jgi:hypothetical protein
VRGYRGVYEDVIVLDGDEDLREVVIEVGSENGIDFNTGASKEELGVVEEIVLSKVGQLRQNVA